MVSGCSFVAVLHSSYSIKTVNFHCVTLIIERLKFV